MVTEALAMPRDTLVRDALHEIHERWRSEEARIIHKKGRAPTQSDKASWWSNEVEDAEYQLNQEGPYLEDKWREVAALHMWAIGNVVSFIPTEYETENMK